MLRKLTIDFNKTIGAIKPMHATNNGPVISGAFCKKGYFGALAGIAMVCALRFFVHFLAGIILWANLEQFVAFGQEWVNRPVLYSICYNGVYMLPETVLTVGVAAILLKIPQIKRLLTV